MSDITNASGDSIIDFATNLNFMPDQSSGNLKSNYQQVLHRSSPDSSAFSISSSPDSSAFSISSSPDSSAFSISSSPDSSARSMTSTLSQESGDTEVGKYFETVQNKPDIVSHEDSNISRVIETLSNKILEYEALAKGIPKTKRKKQEEMQLLFNKITDIISMYNKLKISPSSAPDERDAVINDLLRRIQAPEYKSIFAVFPEGYNSMFSCIHFLAIASQRKFNISNGYLDAGPLVFAMYYVDNTGTSQIDPLFVALCNSSDSIVFKLGVTRKKNDSFLDVIGNHSMVIIVIIYKKRIYIFYGGLYFNRPTGQFVTTSKVENTANAILAAAHPVVGQKTYAGIAGHSITYPNAMFVTPDPNLPTIEDENFKDSQGTLYSPQIVFVEQLDSPESKAMFIETLTTIITDLKPVENTVTPGSVRDFKLAGQALEIYDNLAVELNVPNRTIMSREPAAICAINFDTQYDLTSSFGNLTKDLCMEQHVERSSAINFSEGVNCTQFMNLVIGTRYLCPINSDPNHDKWLSNSQKLFHTLSHISSKLTLPKGSVIPDTHKNIKDLITELSAKLSKDLGGRNEGKGESPQHQTKKEKKNKKGGATRKPATKKHRKTRRRYTMNKAR